MKRLLAYLSALVFGLALVIYSVRIPLRDWAIDRGVQKQAQSLFKAPATYSQLTFEDGQLTLHDLQITSPAGYSVRVEKASIPYQLMFPKLTFAPVTAWSVKNGEVTWSTDHTTCLLNCEPSKGTLTLNQGVIRWNAGNYEFSSVPLKALLRLGVFANPQLRAWVVESGELTGFWSGNSGQLTLVEPHIRHQRYPILLQADQGTLHIVDGTRVSFNAPISVKAGVALNEVLLPDQWTLEIVDRETLKWQWDGPFGQPGQLAMTIHPRGDQLAFNGEYHSHEMQDAFQFQLAVPTEGVVKGHFSGKALSMQPTLMPLARQFLDGNWSGRVDLEGTISGPHLEAKLRPSDLKVETANYQISLEGFETPIEVNYDFLGNRLTAHLTTDHSSFLDKNTGLFLSEISATLATADQRWSLTDLEAYYQNLRFAGSGSYQRSDSTHAELLLHVDAVTGRLKQLQEMLVFLSPRGLVQVIPLDGDVQLGSKGADLTLLTEGPERFLTVYASGALLDGKWKLDVGNLSIQDVGAQFSYAYPANTLSLSDLQGAVLVGRPGERMEEYQFAADQLSFSDYGKQQMRFDLWIGDRRRDVLRLAGYTELGDDQALHFRFDKGLTHIGAVHPEVLELSLFQWSQVKSFELGLNFRLDKLLHDLQRFDRTGLLPVDDKLSKGLQALNEVDGLCRFDCRYDQQSGLFGYELTSDLLTLNQRLHRDFQLKGSVQGNTWLIDPLRWNDVAFSAELVKFTDRWRIEFLGLKVGDYLLAGFEGNYFPRPGQIQAKVNLFDVDLAALSHLPLSGKWKNTGMLTVDLTEFPKRYPVKASLEGAITGLFVNGTRWDNPSKVLTELTSTDDQPKGKVQLLNFPSTSSIKNVTVVADRERLRIDSKLKYRDNSLYARIQQKWEQVDKRILTLTDTNPISADGLTIAWEQAGNRLYVPVTIKGSLLGFDVDLTRDPKQSPADKGLSAQGSVKLNLREVATLLPDTLANQIDQWNLGSGYQLKGDWRLNQLLPDTLNFRGELLGERCQVGDCTIESVKANLRIAPGEIAINALVVGDPSIRGKVESLSFKQTSADHWTFDCQGLVCTGIDLSKFLPDFAGWSLPNLSIPNLNGYLDDALTIVGAGTTQFSKSSRLRAVKLAVPELALPATGSVEWEIANGLLTLLSLKDVYSEGKLLKFSLIKNGPVASVDFDGRLNMRVRVKSSRPLLKLTDKSILSIQGQVKEPIISLQD